MSWNVLQVDSTTKVQISRKLAEDTQTPQVCTVQYLNKCTQAASLEAQMQPVNHYIFLTDLGNCRFLSLSLFAVVTLEKK